MNALVSLLALYSVLIPQKAWFAADQHVVISAKTDSAITLVLTDFSGKRLGTAAAKDKSNIDVNGAFPTLSTPGTYVLYAATDGGGDGAPKAFAGTPLVIEVRSNKEPGAPGGVMVTHVLPLVYADMDTDAGKMQAMFYFDAAPNTVESFLTLAGGGYFDGLLFHRIVPGFVIQGGDPLGADADKAGTGTPGFHVEAEFNQYPHQRGVLSMARSQDPNSAGSQFFVCLDYARTKQLDNNYTAFGKLTAGLDTLDKLGNTPVTNPQNGRADHPPVIKQIKISGVTADHNPYAAL